MILDIKRNIGFSVQIIDNQIKSPDLKFKKSLLIKISSLRKQILNNEVQLPENIYRKYLRGDMHGILGNKDIAMNLLFVYPGMIGIEYCKTLCSRLLNYPKILECVYGAGVLIIYKYNLDYTLETILLRVKAGSKVVLPCGYGYTAINTRKQNFVIAEFHSNKGKTKVISSEKHGAPYYIIAKNSRMEIVRNPNYKNISKYRKVDMKPVLLKYGISDKTPILKQILRKYEKFDWLFTQDSFNSI